MRALLVISALFISSLCLAQAPYAGGSGDGHAMGELVLRTLAVEDDVFDKLTVYPSLLVTGYKLKVTGYSPNHQLTYRIVTLAGSELMVNNLNNYGTIATDQLIPGMYFVELSDGAHSKTFRITVVQ